TAAPHPCCRPVESATAPTGRQRHHSRRTGHIMNDHLGAIEFRPLTIPTSIDSEDARDFVAMTTVRNEIYRETSGHDDHSLTPAEILPHYRPNEYERRLSWLVLENGHVIGRV